MKYILAFIFLLCILSCKNEEKQSTKNIYQAKELEINNFEKKLFDLRDVDVKFKESYSVNKFGVLKKNDSIYSYVLRLDENVTNEEVKRYSIGVRSYSHELIGEKKMLKKNFSPSIKIRDSVKYLILNNKFKNIKYIDSIEAYIYARKDWKSSGRLGTIIIRDILFEDKKTNNE